MTLAEQRDGSALVFVVPEVADVIGTFRSQYIKDDPSIPPHITLLYPFFAPSETTPDVLRRVEGVTSAARAFDYTATGLATFGQQVIYLTPEPVAPFLTLIAHLGDEFPEITPYWDKYGGAVPHITVADLGLAEGADVKADVEATVLPHLPIRCTAAEVLLLQRRRPAPAPWDVRANFMLGSPGHI